MREEREERCEETVVLQGEAVEKEIARLRERLLYLQAEFENYRKQVTRESAVLVRKTQDREVLDFLAVYDALERAIRTYQKDNDAEGFVVGVKSIFAQFSEILRRKGYQPFGSIGKKFDPLFHEALVAEHTEAEKNVIVEEFEQGWQRDGEVIRPAKVKVSLGPKGGEPA